jgi:hypothetical protein
MSLNVLQVIQRALVLHGQIAGGATPAPDVAADMLIAFNAMKRAWFGTLIGPRMTSIGLSGTSAQAENGGEYVIPQATAFTLYAPGNPRPGARFGLLDTFGSFSSYPCTINPNGRSIVGIANGGNLVYSTSGQAGRFWYRGDTGNWVQEADFASLTSAIEFPDAIIAYMPYMLAVAAAAEFGADIREEVAFAAGEGRAVLARTYGRRGRGAPEGPIGLPQAAPAQAGG